MPDYAKIGRFSRNKGRREEQQLVLYLAKLGYQAERILRQYLTPGEADVRAVKGDKTYTFELKSRRDSYKRLYTLYETEKDADGLLCFVLSADGTAVAISTDFESVANYKGPFRNLIAFPPKPIQLKDFFRFVKLNELRQSADYLVIKNNNKKRLFIRYWL